MINDMFKAVENPNFPDKNSINFMTFAAIYNLYLKFHKFSKETKGLLN